MSDLAESVQAIAEQVAGRYAAIGLVEAVALAGSRTTPYAGENSDIDLYIYSRSPLPVGLRAVVAATGSTLSEVDNQFWEPGDEWIDSASNIHVDAIFRTQRWIEDQLDRILGRHEATVGYSTCFWHNVLTSRILFDRSGWFSALQRKARQPYPWKLKGAIISKNYPILRDSLSSYRAQLHWAIERSDVVSINHRIAAFTASVIDILFAVNELPHPGEKQLMKILEAHCTKLPERFRDDLDSLLRAAGNDHGSLLADLDLLLDRLEELLRREGLL
jgi:hypothetical protein